jgi:outer membrane lipoprotein-sorting protein
MHKYWVCFAFFLAVVVAQDARSVVEKSNDLLRANSSYSEVSLTIIKPEWQRQMAMKTWALEPDYSLIYITEPAKSKGMVTLRRDKEVWNWLPAAQRVVKIPPSMMLQSWMGSDFTNDDLVKQSSIIDDYKHQNIGSESIDGYDCHIIELVPNEDAAVVWGKIKMWISKKEYFQLKIEFYDEDDILVKTMLGSKIVKMDDRTIPAYWEMIPHDKPGHKTIFEYHTIDFDKPIKAGFFSQQNMKRIR